MLDADELQLIAELAIEHDLLVVTDEVYEHLVFDGAQHVPLATCPACASARSRSRQRRQDLQHDRMEDRLDLRARPRSSTAARTAKQFLTYVSGAPFQPAIAAGLGLPDCLLHRVRRRHAGQARPALPGLHAAGFDVFRPRGTYFVTVDIRPLEPDGDGMAFCRALPGRCGVVAIPNEVFYANRDEGRHLVRFAFCKRPEVLDEAAARLAKLATG